MSTPYELIFDNTVFAAQVIFVGTRCGRENLLRSYSSGTLHFVKSSRATVQLEGHEPVAIEQPCAPSARPSDSADRRGGAGPTNQRGARA